MKPYYFVMYRIYDEPYTETLTKEQFELLIKENDFKFLSNSPSNISEFPSNSIFAVYGTVVTK